MSAGVSRSGPAETAAAVGCPPSVWVLTEGRAGDDAQLLELAGALDWPVDVLELQGNSNWQLVRDRIADLLGFGGPPLRLPAEAPARWPDLVLAIAGRSVSTARRIVRASGGRTRIVHLGRPVASLAGFDLVITTPQYGLPERDNVLLTPLPFCPPRDSSEPPDLGAAEAFASLPRPWTALLVGGDSGSYRLTARSVERLLATARAATADGGSVLVTTSPRTPAHAMRAVREATPDRGFFYEFERDDPNNPYAAMLALADKFVVTGESASMIAEAVSTGRPVEIVPLDERPLARALVRSHRALKRSPLGPLLDALCARGLWMPPRDLGAIHEALAEGQARRGAAGEAQRVVERIRALAGGAGS